MTNYEKYEQEIKEIILEGQAIAKNKDKLVILDPAPAINNLPDELFKNIDRED